MPRWRVFIGNPIRQAHQPSRLRGSATAHPAVKMFEPEKVRSAWASSRGHELAAHDGVANPRRRPKAEVACGLRAVQVARHEDELHREARDVAGAHRSAAERALSER